MSEFIFAIKKYNQEKQEFSGVPYNVVVSTKTYFGKEKCVQDSYNDNDYAKLISICDKYDLTESQESYFECMPHGADQIKKLLSNEPLFAYSQELQDFIDKCNNKFE